MWNAWVQRECTPLLYLVQLVLRPESTCLFVFSWGVQATAGWDPVTGFGTPDFEKLKEIILKI